jgi:uncharacterized protein
MSRLFLLVAIAIVVYLLIKSYRKNMPRQDDIHKAVTEDMVRCAKCGVHLPKGESILAEGNYFCCVEHRNAYRK